MATVDQLVTISRDQGFIARVQYAMVTSAIAIYNEASNTPGHTARAAFAVRILSSGSLPYGIVLAVLTNSTIAAEANPATTPDFGILDTDIQFQVNSMWNALAGA